MAIRETRGRNRSWGEGKVDLDDDDVIEEVRAVDARESGVDKTPTYWKLIPTPVFLLTAKYNGADRIDLPENHTNQVIPEYQAAEYKIRGPKRRERGREPYINGRGKG